MPRSLKHAPLLAGLWLAANAGLALANPGAAACGTCNTKMECPPKFIHYYEDGPKLKFKRGCPRPVCDPCNLERFGYYQTCWSPWPYGPDWSHCHHPTPSQMLPPPRIPPYTPRTPVAAPGYDTERRGTPDMDRRSAPEVDPRPTPTLPRPRPDEPEIRPLRPPTVPELPEPKKTSMGETVHRVRIVN